MYDNIEIILVDDGSPDRCPIIADAYAKDDSRIKVIHKQNGGLSDARNEGIKIATGEYILFIDSDDYEGHLILLERCKEQCDILIVGVCNDDYVQNIKHKQPIYTETQRLRLLNALKVVDRAELVSIEETEDKIKALERFRFDVLFSGDDWKGSDRFLKTEEQFKTYGVKIEYFPYTQGISTSELKQKL